MVDESLSAMCFCGLELEVQILDHSTLSRFISELTRKKAVDRLLLVINKQLESHRITIHIGVKVDASTTGSTHKPKGKITYQLAEDRKEDQLPESEIDKQSSQ